MVLGLLTSYMQENKLRPLLYTLYQISSRYKNVNVRANPAELRQGEFS